MTRFIPPSTRTDRHPPAPATKAREGVGQRGALRVSENAQERTNTSQAPLRFKVHVRSARTTTETDPLERLLPQTAPLFARVRVGSLARSPAMNRPSDPPNDNLVFGAESFEVGCAFAGNQRKRFLSPTPPAHGRNGERGTDRSLQYTAKIDGDMRRHLLGAEP